MKPLAPVFFFFAAFAASAGEKIPGWVGDKYGTVPEKQLPAWCNYMGKAIRGIGWKLDPCGLPWKVGGTSIQGRPLIYGEFGNLKSQNTTLVFSMVHGDETTPLYLGLQLARWVQENEKELGDVHVVIAPMVNPDGFFRTPKTRVNARGVDVNRNLDTKDWAANALKSWKSKFRSDPRRYPGPKANSEPETAFQMELMKTVHPQKILSVHAPLNFLDYDGPGQLTLEKFSKEYIQECAKLREQVKAIVGTFYPGSLGNYAGLELGIPTFTLELPTTNPLKADAYWKKFQSGIRTMIEFKVPPPEASVVSTAAHE